MQQLLFGRIWHLRLESIPTCCTVSMLSTVFATLVAITMRSRPESMAVVAFVLVVNVLTSEEVERRVDSTSTVAVRYYKHYHPRGVDSTSTVANATDDTV